MNQYTVTLRLNDQDNSCTSSTRSARSPANSWSPLRPTRNSNWRLNTEAKAEPKVEPKARSIRGSKVNETILAALHNSTLTVKQLKEALESRPVAGLAIDWHRGPAEGRPDRTRW